MLAKAFASLVDAVLPPRCPSCGQVQREHHAFCAPCWAALPWLPDPACTRCAEPMPPGTPPGDCLNCLADPPAFAEARAATLYEGPARDLVLRFKNGAEHLAEPLARAMRAQARGWFAGAVVLPVPLHPSRLAQRGFNQAGWLARAAARGTGARVEWEWLLRRRPTRSTAGLTRDQRLREAFGAYAVPPAIRPKLKGARVVLVDDVMTTGATLRAAARPLVRAGADVRCLVFARVARGRTAPQ